MQKVMLRSVAKNISEPMNLEMVMGMAKTVYPRLNLTENQARSVIRFCRIGPDLFCGTNSRTV